MSERGHDILPSEKQVIVLPKIVLEWTRWYRWEEVLSSARDGGIRVPDLPGVYEARRVGEDQRLTIGKAANLRMRVKQGLVKGKVRHSTGRKIRLQEKTESVVVRWASTDRPAAVEEELHRQHRERFGHLPVYTQHT